MKKLTSYIFPLALAVALLAALTGAAEADDRSGALMARQNEAHAAAELLRELGVPEDSEAIEALSNEWWRCEAQLSRRFAEAEVIMLAKTIWGEGSGVQSITENACIAWTVCNRVDDPRFPDTITGVLTQANQFCYYTWAPVREDLLWLAEDVLTRWSAEHAGAGDVGRVLPREYLWYTGDGDHNYFRDAFCGGDRWDYALPSPYES